MPSQPGPKEASRTRFTPRLEEAKREQARADWSASVPELERLLTEARTYLLVRHHFFGRLAMRLRFVFTERVESMAITADMTCYANPDFVRKLDLAERAFLVAHEICHLGYLHFDRQGPRPAWLWNWATDYMINDMLKEAGLKLPRFDGRWADNPGHSDLSSQSRKEDNPFMVLYAERFQGKSDVEIYEVLRGEVRQAAFPWLDDEAGRSRGGIGTWQGDCDFNATDEVERSGRRILTPAQVRELLISAADATRRSGRGTVPAGMERWIAELREPKLPWHRILDRWISSVLVSGQSYRRPARSSAALAKAVRGRGMTGLQPILPGGRPALEPVIIGIDTSGSRTPGDLADDLSELFSILARYDNPVRVVAWDADVHFDGYVRSVDEVDLIGGGGTDTVPLFERIEDDPGRGGRVAALICFTDGMAGYPEHAPSYPVLWVWTGEGGILERPPFGQVLEADQPTV